MKYIFYSITNDFEKFHRRNEIEALVKLSSDSKAVYFNPPVFFIKKLISVFKKKEKVKRVKHKINNVYISNLYVFFPIKWARKSNLLMKVFVSVPIELQTWYAKKKYFYKANGDVFSWFYKPDQYLYLKSLSPYIYLHYDNYKDDESYGFSKDSRFDKVLRECILNSELTLVSSARLYNKYKSINESLVYYYPNAIARSLMQRPKVQKCAVNKNKSVIGFIGQLDSTFDWTLIEKIANFYPDYLIKLIGGGASEEAVNISLKYNNIKLLGYMHYEELSSQIQSFSIGICPYKKSDFNKYRNPLKITEYFSYGLPVVTVECDVDSNARKLITVAQTDTAFVEAIDTELKANTEDKTEQRRLFASHNCWGNRAAFISSTLHARRNL